MLKICLANKRTLHYTSYNCFIYSIKICIFYIIWYRPPIDITAFVLNEGLLPTLQVSTEFYLWISGLGNLLSRLDYMTCSDVTVSSCYSGRHSAFIQKRNQLWINWYSPITHCPAYPLCNNLQMPPLYNRLIIVLMLNKRLAKYLSDGFQQWFS